MPRMEHLDSTQALVFFVRRIHGLAPTYTMNVVLPRSGTYQTRKQFSVEGCTLASEAKAKSLTPIRVTRTLYVYTCARTQVQMLTQNVHAEVAP